MSLTEAVWPQFATQVFGGAVSTPFGEMGGSDGPNWYRQFFCKTYV